MTIQAIIHPAEEGGYWAEVPSLPGCLTEAESLEELKSNLLEAVQGWMEAAQERAQKLLEPNSSLLALAV
jgi:predicted RNase H-like HicB family nuclease